MSADRPVVREIITKAVCGQGTYKYQRSIDLEVPVGHSDIQVLGTFVSNPGLDEAVVVDNTKYGKAVQVKGHYDVHVWYAPDQETRSAKTTVTFIEYIPINLIGGESISNPQAFAKISQKPRCRKAYVLNSGDKTVIRVEIEQDLACEVIGLTKVKVGISSSPGLFAEPVKGRELIPPSSSCFESPSPENYFDMKCEEDLPDEDYDDYEDNEYLTDDYNY